MFDMTEMKNLMMALVDRGVAFTFKGCNDGFCICGDGWDVAINSLTMGNFGGRLEMLVYETNIVHGYMDALEAIDRLETLNFIPRLE